MGDDPNLFLWPSVTLVTAGGAADALGVKPTTLYGKMRKHHIPKDRSRPPRE
jgi:hypothetical protein